MQAQGHVLAFFLAACINRYPVNAAPLTLGQRIFLLKNDTDVEHTEEYYETQIPITPVPEFEIATVVKGFLVGIIISLAIVAGICLLLLTSVKFFARVCRKDFRDIDGIEEAISHFYKGSSKCYEDKWQINQLTKQLKTVMEREFVGLKTDLTADFDSRVIAVVDEIDNLVDASVVKHLGGIKHDIIEQMKVQVENQRILS